MVRRDFDVAVLGGGPAGAATALRLAGRGFRVVLLERAAGSELPAGEVLPPAARPLLARLQVWERFDKDGHRPAHGVLSAWGTDELAIDDFICSPHGHGWHLDRRRFDQMLRAAALANGACLRLDTAVTQVRSEEQGWAIQGRTRAEPVRLRARFLVDARGRAAVGLLAPPRRVYDALVAIIVSFDATGEAPEPFTLVESCPEGWFYSALPPDGRRVVAYMTDADLVRGKGRHLQGAFAAALGQAPHTRGRIAGRRALEPPRVALAHTSVASPEDRPRRLPVGDAAFSLDPLSAQGLFAALASALFAADAIEASLSGDSGAIGQYGSWARDQFQRHLRARRLHYGREQRFSDSVFWTRRAGLDAPSTVGPAPFAGTVTGAPSVGRANA